MKQVMQNAYYWLKNDVLVALLHVLRLYSMIRPQLESKYRFSQVMTVHISLASDGIKCYIPRVSLSIGNIISLLLMTCLLNSTLHL